MEKGSEEMGLCHVVSRRVATRRYASHRIDSRQRREVTDVATTATTDPAAASATARGGHRLLQSPILQLERQGEKTARPMRCILVVRSKGLVSKGRTL